MYGLDTLRMENGGTCRTIRGIAAQAPLGKMDLGGLSVK